MEKMANPHTQLIKEKSTISRRALSGSVVNIWACTTLEKTLQKNWSLRLTAKKSWKE